MTEPGGERESEEKRRNGEERVAEGEGGTERKRGREKDREEDASVRIGGSPDRRQATPRREGDVVREGGSWMFERTQFA